MKKATRTESRVSEKKGATVIRYDRGEAIPPTVLSPAFYELTKTWKGKLKKTPLALARELRYGASTKRKPPTDSSVSEKGATIIRYDKGEPIPPTPLSPAFYKLAGMWKGKLDKTPLALARELRYGR